jgi:hypothetical protein
VILGGRLRKNRLYAEALRSAKLTWSSSVKIRSGASVCLLAATLCFLAGGSWTAPASTDSALLGLTRVLSRAAVAFAAAEAMLF